jgi:predicted DCC family thiol-disulfide oxidoreductase YuxK
MSEKMPADPCGQLTVYYDGACPLCRREIAIYKSAEGAERLAFIDVACAPADGPATDLDRNSALARFHVRDSEGRLVSGAAAFGAMWLALPRWRWLGWLVTRRPMLPIAEAAYRGFLKIRPAIQRRFRARAVSGGIE